MGQRETGADADWDDPEAPDPADCTGADEDESTSACPECGAAIWEESQQCPRCGAYVAMNQHRGPGRWTIIIGIALLVLFALFLVWR